MEHDAHLTRAEAEEFAAQEEKHKIDALARWVVRQDQKTPGFARDWLANVRPSLADVVRPLARAYWRDQKTRVE